MPEVIGQFLPIFWLILAIILGVIEAVSVQLVAVWFALGAVAAIIPAALGASMEVQFLVFTLVSAAALICTRPLTKSILKTRRVRTNADSVIGKIGIVVQRIDNAQSMGRVSVSGLDWSARSEDGDFIEEEERVLIKAIDGVKLIVERLN